MARKILIKHGIENPTPESVDCLGGLVVLCPPDHALRGLPYGKVLAGRRRGACFSTELPNAAGTRATLAEVKADASAFQLLTLGRRIAAQQFVTDPAEVGIVALGLKGDLALRAREAVVAAILAAREPLPTFKSEETGPRRLKSLHLFGVERKPDLSRTLAEAEGNHLARSLTALPANKLTPKIYRQKVAALARQEGWNFKFFGVRELEALGAGAFLAVAQGSPEADAGMVRLRYAPPKARGAKRIALVGKGICFDTGGTNLKSSRHMHGMHQDMAGSAVALGTLLALTRLRAPFAVECWLALAQNHIGPRAYKQNDVVTAVNGTTIEVIHTDSEGRMVLADTLAMASEGKPNLLIDFATLTGSCIQALGTAYSGACTNREAFIPTIIEAGRASGERVWPFPMDEDFDAPLESELADIKQCTLGNEADHILGGRFLLKFIDEEVPWIHLDLASAAHRGGLAHVPTEVTGFGVRYTLNLLLDQRVMERESQ